MVAAHRLPAPVRIRRVLVPFTGADVSAQILAYAFMLGTALSASVTLLRITPQGPENSTAPDQERLYSEMRALQTRLGEAPTSIELLTTPSASADVILRFVAEREVDLIVLARDKRGQGLPRALIREIAEEAPCATLAVAA